MKNEIAQAMLVQVMNWKRGEDINSNRPYLQNIARYKYDDYQQFSTGMRFVERLALWLNQFDTHEEKEIALDFVKKRLVFISSLEMNHLVNATYPDVIKNVLLKKISDLLGIPDYSINKIISTNEFKLLKRQCLFLGLSDGSKIDLFRRANVGILSHEQIYQTYELSIERSIKMKKSLIGDVKAIKAGKSISKDDSEFKVLFLIDDFSASGKSCISLNENNELKGKIPSLFQSIQQNEELLEVINLKEIEIYIVLYLCTPQAFNYILSFNEKLIESGYKKVNILPVFKFNDDIMLDITKDKEIIDICLNDDYYDGDLLEDSHTRVGGENVKLGFGNCSLPLILHHNTPNNSVSILWAYDESEKFKGLFPRVPRHKDL